MTPHRGGFLERLSREEWNIGVIRQPAGDIVQRGIVQPVKWLEPSHPWYGVADPSCYVHQDESRTVFAARLNYWSGRGEIWTAQLPPHGAVISGFRRWAKADIHLSCPFPIPEKQGYCLTMETGEAGKLYLWRNTKMGWSRTTLLDRPAVNPTIWRGSDRWWLFCTFADSNPDRDLHLFHAEQLNGPWLPHPLNPVKSDLASARPAGPLFQANDGRLIRPSQDSTQSYGSAVVLNVITELTVTSFREQPLRRLMPQREYLDGLHTICPAGDVTLVDGKRWGINILDPARYLMVGVRKRLRRLRRKDATVHFMRSQ